MRKFSDPDHSKVVKIGKFYVPANFGLGSGSEVHVELAPGCFERIDIYRLHRLLKELGVTLAFDGWASWERDNWRIEGNHVVFHELDCTWCHHSIKIPKDDVLDILLLLKCPHLSKRGVTFLKRCDCCVYHYEGCHYKSPFFQPIRTMMKHGLDNFINSWRTGGHGYADWGASLRFTIDHKKEKLVESLHKGHNVKESEDSTQFILHYGFKHNGIIPDIYTITIPKNGDIGKVSDTESGECDSHEEWQQIEWDMNSSKKANVIEGFKRVCHDARGKVSPMPSWKEPQLEALFGGN